ncbi:hypothetical protein [Paenibacillus eucommiae]|uniref:ABC-type siderophore export system fused ATPase/permease subunit n=1 Tax=Paenibacillus eucommiae TaxID=1355755 RepID=A0ABS4J5J6_9BACL|nr:hypothetical protein [Paenibacillus eucommiae]MBP1995119.1 ABC-type siderophore export system fused ATPase/permease subunit [Paenibacillus eucommiae]
MLSIGHLTRALLFWLTVNKQVFDALEVSGGFHLTMFFIVKVSLRRPGGTLTMKNIAKVAARQFNSLLSGSSPHERLPARKFPQPREELFASSPFEFALFCTL